MPEPTERFPSPPLSTWQQALDYLYGLANWESRPPGTAHTFELERIRAVLSALDEPHRRFKAVHVGGTNGKGSTCAYVASALVEAGYRVGLYTSPHLHTVRERIQVSGELVPADWVIGWINRWHPMFVDHPGLTTFEALTALAFSYFAEQGVDIAVVEVGLGGRLDTTNVVDPAVSVLTPIDLDHTEVLGNTVAEIASDKAGIFKPGVPVVSAPQATEADTVITSVADEMGSSVYRVGQEATSEMRPEGLMVRVPGFEVLVPRLLEGPHQRLNATTAVLTLAVLRGSGWRVPLRAIAEGVAAATWPGRFEALPAPLPGSRLANLAGVVLSRGEEGPRETSRASGGHVAEKQTSTPPGAQTRGTGGPPDGDRQSGPHVPGLLVDGAHNPHAARALASAITARFGDEPVVLLLGFTRGKDVLGVAEALLPVAKAVVVTRSRHAKAMSVEEAGSVLAEAADRLNRDLPVIGADDHMAAVSEAIRAAGLGGHIVASGSLFVAGNLRELWLEAGGHPVPPSDGPPPDRLPSR